MTLARYVDDRGNSNPSDDIRTTSTPIAAASRPAPAASRWGTAPRCPPARSPPGLKRYEISTGGGDDRVADQRRHGRRHRRPRRGTDRFTGLGSGSAADVVKGGRRGRQRHAHGGLGNDALAAAADADKLSGDPGDDIVGGGDGGDDQVAGQDGNDTVDGGPGNDSVEFGGTGLPAGGGAGDDDLYGGDGVDLLSYNDRGGAIAVTMDGQPGDGAAPASATTSTATSRR